MKKNEALSRHIGLVYLKADRGRRIGLCYPASPVLKFVNLFLAQQCKKQEGETCWLD